MADREEGIALQRYGVVMQYLAYENTTYWTRAQFFMLANTALLGFVLSTLPASLPHETRVHLSLLFLGTIAGLLLVVLWIRSLKAGERWIRHWEGALEHWEQDAMARKLLRERPPGKDSAKRVARLTAYLFTLLWIFVGAFIVMCFVLKVLGGDLP